MLGRQLGSGYMNPAGRDTDLDTVITHREYIQDVVSSGTTLAFSLSKINVNPGLQQSFPWLSQVAGAYQYYEIEGVSYHYVPTCATAVANGTNVSLGFVLMRYVHDPVVAQDTTEFQMQNSYECIRNIAYAPIDLDIELKDKHIVERIVRTSLTQPANTDLRMYDTGYLEIASSGVVATSQTLGKLYVSYRIKLLRPSMLGGQVGLANVLSDHFQLNAITSNTTWLGTNATRVLASGSSIGGTCTTTTYTFPNSFRAGSYMIIYQMSGVASGANTLPTLSLGAGITNLFVFSSSAANDALNQGFYPEIGASTGNACITMLVQLTGSTAGPVITITGGTYGNSGASKGDLWVIQCNSNIIT